MTIKRRPSRKFPTKFEIRPVNMSELSPGEQAMLKAALKDTSTDKYTEVAVKNQRGLKVKIAPQVMAGLSEIPAADLAEILQHIVDHTAAERRRKRTKPKLGRKSS